MIIILIAVLLFAFMIFAAVTTIGVTSFICELIESKGTLRIKRGQI